MAAAKVLVDEKFVSPAPAVSTSLPEKIVQPSTAEQKIATPKPSPVPLSETAQKGVAAAPTPAFAVATTVEAKIEAQGVKSAPGKTPAEEKPSIFSMAVTATGAMIAIGMVGVLIWTARHLGQPISASTESTSQATGENNLREAAPAVPAPPLKIGATAQVTGIHHSSTADSSTLVIDLEDQVQYEEHTLDNPPRVYFDLHDTRLSPMLASQTITIDDAYLKRVRVAQPAEGITRVVLETKGPRDASVPSVSLDNNPYRLTIEFHKATATPQASPAPGTLPKPSPAVNVSPSKPRASTEALGKSVFEVVLDAGHDSAGQTLAVMQMNLAQLVKQVQQNAPELAGGTAAIEELARQLSQEIRTTSYLLHPPLLEETGLSGALGWYTEGLSARSGLEISLSLSDDLGRLPSDIELVVFRLVQECLTNIHRHSQSKKAEIRVSRKATELTLEVRDCGKGMSPERLAQIQSRGSGVGVPGMRERVRQLGGSMRQLAANPWDSLIDKYPVGATVEGRVRNLTDFGAFIEIEEGIDGLVHVSNLSWTKRVKHPSEVLKKGDRVKAVVLAIDSEKRRLSLGVKQLQPDVWESFFQQHRIGDIVHGKVLRVAAFGSFVEIAEGVEGLCHNSEAVDANGQPVHLEPGSEHDFKIIKMSPEEKKVGLSIRAAGEEASRTEVEAYKHPASSTGSTIGELVNWKRENA